MQKAVPMPRGVLLQCHDGREGTPKTVYTAFVSQENHESRSRISALGVYKPFWQQSSMIYYCPKGSRPIADGTGRSYILFAHSGERAVESTQAVSGVVSDADRLRGGSIHCVCFFCFSTGTNILRMERSALVYDLLAYFIYFSD